jgi:gamma-polyglutamate biosynthesis protein CapA
MKGQTVFFGLLLSIVLVVSLWVVFLRVVKMVPEYTIADIEVMEVNTESIVPVAVKMPQATSTLFITGDVMLGRHVEFLMKRHGAAYPYTALGLFTAELAYVLGNFEASVPEVHVPTPNFAMRFSVAETFLPALRLAGFTHLGLANNHTFDYGETGFSATKAALARQNFVTFGHPYTVSSDSVTFFPLGERTVSVVSLMSFDTEPDREKVKEILVKAREESDLQIAYVHWGSEYEILPHSGQVAYAEFLVALGIDLIVGHHPHVLQRADFIGKIPVFYSLGNLIFDQYFSQAVQEGVILKLAADKNGVLLSAIPVSSRDTQAQPKPLTGAAAAALFEDWATFSNQTLIATLQNDGYLIPWSLATSTEIAIMDQ